MTFLEGIYLLLLAIVLISLLLLAFLRFVVRIIIPSLIAHYTQGPGKDVLKNVASAAIPKIGIKEGIGMAIGGMAQSGMFQDIGQAVGQWVKGKLGGAK